MLNQSLMMHVVALSLVTFLSASNVARIDKTTDEDKKAHEYSIASSTLGFVGLGIVLGSMLPSRYYILLVLSSIAAALLGLTLYSYDKLNTTTSEKNKNERNVALASFCFSLVALVLGFSFFLVHHSTKVSVGGRKK